jgi:hypothetical protein
MASFDMSRAWNEAQATLTQHFALIAGLVAGGAIIGAILQYGVFGYNEAELTLQITAMTQSGVTPDPAALLATFGGIFAAAMAAGLFSGAATMAAYRLVLAGQAEDNLVSALVYGFIATLATTVVFFVIFAVVAFILALFFGLLIALGVVGGIIAFLLLLGAYPRDPDPGHAAVASECGYGLRAQRQPAIWHRAKLDDYPPGAVAVARLHCAADYCGDCDLPPAWPDRHGVYRSHRRRRG